MGSRTNFYKNPAYIYNKDFDLSSALDNLRAYNLATGNVSPSHANVNENDHERTVNVDRKRKKKNYDLERKSESRVSDHFTNETLDHETYKAKQRSAVFPSGNFSTLY
eukprot:Gb_13165 [translate_table: standard]